NENINITGTLGGNIRQDTYSQTGEESVNQIVFGFANHANFSEHSSTNGQALVNGQPSPMQFKSTKIWEGVFGTVTMDYKRFLYVNLAARNDWTSTVEKSNN